jgi:glycosyltransferase involved in cell wall biosynthesis
VVPSRIDNLPQTATEAQACGVPVVAFRTGGLPDAVEDGRSGLLVEPFSVSALAGGVVRVLQDGLLRQELGAYARKRAVELWSPEVVIPQYVDAYRQTLERPIALCSDPRLL